MYLRTISILFAGLLLGQPALAMPGPSPQQAAPANSPGAWLGVMVAPVPPELGTHLRGLADTDQGILVTHVEDDSPAARAHLERFDVLLSVAESCAKWVIICWIIKSGLLKS